MRSPAYRLFVALILALWTVPSGAGLAVGLHVALEHQHDPAHEVTTPDWLDLAIAATHGHHHDVEVVPDHRHDAIADGLGPRLTPQRDAIAGPDAIASPVAVAAGGMSLGRRSTRGPPLPLFTHHCSLLL